MTRRDLEEAIGDLEYLINNRFDPSKVEGYSQQLLHFREELRAWEATERHAGGTAADSRAAVAKG